MVASEADLPSRRLKAATAHLHRRIEDGLDVFKKAETIPGYVELLRRFEAFYRVYEPTLPFSDGRTRRLQTDLDLLAPGWSPLSPMEPPAFATPAHELGGLYVIEGAALGGQIIARFLHARHGLTATSGASFFASEGHPVGPRWKGVRASIDATEDYPSTEAGAVATFLAFESNVVREAALA